MPILPFVLPERPPVTRIRQVDPRALARGSERTQAMPGFEDRFRDIVDYIVRITDEIWIERAVGYIYDTYAVACTVYATDGVIRSVEEVVASTIATLNAFPDGEIHHLNVAWSGDERTGFYTSHLGYSRSTNVGRTSWGPGTGRRSSIRFAADCISRENRIDTEWLVRDTGAQARQLGFDPHDLARRAAETTSVEHFAGTCGTRLEADATTVEGWACGLFDDIWNLRRLDRLSRHYARDVVAHAAGGRIAQGLRNYQTLLLHVMAALPGGVMRVEHVSWSEETDGVIVAVRWTLEGRTAAGGVFGMCPAGKAAIVLGISHLRLGRTGLIVEEWMMFDEVGTLAQAYS